MREIKTVGIIGYGRFGQFLHKILQLSNEDLTFKIHDNNQESENNTSIKETVDSDLLFIAVPIREFESVIKEISEIITSNTIVTDVCSVKMYPKKVLLENLPENVQLLASHPMFGPGDFDEQTLSLKKLNKARWVIDRVRINGESYVLVKNLLSDLKAEIIEMDSDTHDKIAAKTQFTSLLTAFTLKNVDLKKTEINTISSDCLIDFVEMITIDQSLLKDIFEYNPYCEQALNEFEKSLNDLKEFLIK